MDLQDGAIGSIAAVVAGWIIYGIRKWILRQPGSLPIEHSTAKAEQYAKSAWRTLAEYCTKNGLEEYREPLEKLAADISKKELQWPGK